MSRDELLCAMEVEFKTLFTKDLSIDSDPALVAEIQPYIGHIIDSDAVNHYTSLRNLKPQILFSLLQYKLFPSI